MRPCLRSNPSAHVRWCWVAVLPLPISVSVWRPISRPRGSNLFRLSFSSHPLEILLTAVELKLSLKRLEPMGQEIRHQTLSLIGSGGTATQHQRT